MHCTSVSRLCLRNGKFYSKFNTFGSLKTAEKQAVTVTPENQYELLSDVVTPWWKIDYAEQLLLKKKWSRKVVETLKSRKLLKKFRTVIHDVIPSPVIESYRNKDEFSIRTGVDGNEKTVGFYIGSPAHGEAVCVPPTKLITLKEEHIRLSQVFQALIQSSPLKACHYLNDGGFWRNIVVRSNRKGEVMVIVIVHPDGATEEQLEHAKEQMKDAFLQCSSVSSLYFQPCRHSRCKADQAPYIHLHGAEHLFENFDDIVIRISPDSFSEINTDAGLILYRRALDFLQVDSKTTLLDVCCTTGIVSLLASRSVRGCIGLEHLGHTVDDAVFNAMQNQITNCHFISDRMEMVLKNVLSELASEVVLVLKPGGTGINRRIISLLRQRRNIERFVYLASKASNAGAMSNFVDLCSRSFDSSPPFSLTAVQPLDMFPQTSQCELILYFER